MFWGDLDGAGTINSVGDSSYHHKPLTISVKSLLAVYWMYLTVTPIHEQSKKHAKHCEVYCVGEKN